jgi:CubicO group peptidase (beta-lactamase class C family)
MIMIRKVFVLLIAAIAALQASAQTKSILLDSFVQQYAKLKNFNGAVLVAQKGSILLQKGYGWSNVEKETASSPKGLYQYGSVTKQFTAALILKLEEMGKLRVDDKLSKYFPQFSFADSVTLHHLLTHTSGIYNYTADGGFMTSEATKPTTQNRIFELFQKKPLGFVPGSKFSYSNSNYMLLGYIAEKVTGKPYESLLRQYILQPAAMNGAGFDFAHLQAADKATGYNAINGKQAFAAGIVDSSVSYAAGALYGTVYDLYAWHKAMQAGKLLSAQSWKKMNTPFQNKYGLGVSIDSSHGQQRISHGGGIFGFVSDFERFPEADVAIVVLSNNGSVPVGDISAGLAALVFDKEAQWPAVRKEVAVPVSVLERYVGAYELMPNFIITMTVEDGHLMGQATGQPKSQLYAESETKFFLKVVDAQIEFSNDGTGAIPALRLLQGGQVIIAPKIK